MTEADRQEILHILAQFSPEGTPVDCKVHTGGFINRSYRITCDSGKRYLLQRISSAAFKDIPGLMHNFTRVCDHLRSKDADPRKSLHALVTPDGKSYVTDREGGCWRVLDFIEDSLCMDIPGTPEDFYETALAIGRFQRNLADFPMETLCETIPGFHHTPGRFRQFFSIVSKDPYGRLAEVADDVAYLSALKEEGGILQRMRDAGRLPSRVTHNDAKISNVLFDRKTRKALCLVDLDTVMPGLAAFDFGEAIRAGASGAKEDEEDLSKVQLRLDLVEVFTKGFVSACETLTRTETETLMYGAKLMTLENAIRILGDYIAGDVYYTCAYPKQNLYRARTQIKLLKEMTAHQTELEEIIRAV